MNCAVIVVGAGRGTRHGGEVPKQYQLLGGTPVFTRTLMTFLNHNRINTVIAVIAEDAAPLFTSISEGLAVRTVFGGASRTASVRAGLAALADTPPDLLLIHDAARPLVSESLITRLIEAASPEAGAAPGMALSDALKKVDHTAQAGEDVARAGLVSVQTPQVFPFAPLYKAYKALADNEDLPDDLAVARTAGMKCKIIPGDVDNFKITNPGDLERAERIVQPQNGFQLCVTGTGYDVHRLIPGTQMMLGGVPIKGDLALLGHSDADAALHALTDALLGTIGAGDIGDHFPPSDPQWKNVDSTVFLQKALDLLGQQSACVRHVDLTIICEKPKIKPHRAAMRARLGELLGLDPSHISVKATTTEGLGYTGRGEGLAVMATVTVSR
ncbi:MAG: bifunctional 2-C-methyl-D-erythritol 4-phosphate cytidylyltransferase/2-C-methyl-D-erythritol 2,4-cyclodiphosphate synthase [Robiginitomaculum sp.]|nr:bifunctional 2-C-methyl-D-erythritol 4-phosphate cytidylyltransferase/2-C-methyl-D-erythritol 2,4-cyclodiphosphate synthase [Robiginitomaculum sp.]MDQ7078211.1 bifunctional 2-C-methyl-D-erythritol 4-phosphate cytidylyltransferase/2-C-methyl-D-erythritol 2,4-cyclodiphosphate synthase [Robiginitomaculum sp.]